MADRSKIEWTDASWNPIRARNLATGMIGWHCVHTSEGCRNCYAETMNKRLGTGLDYKPGNREAIDIFLDEKLLTQPLHWKRPRKIFVGSMTDLFADFVADDMLDRIFAVMALCPQHTFQLLTKRPERMRQYLTVANNSFDIGHACGLIADIIERMRKDGHGMPWNGIGPVGHLAPGAHWWPLSNIWLGVTCEDQQTADARIPELLATPAAVRFISAEPLLGPIDLTDHCNGHYFFDSLRGTRWHDDPDHVNAAEKFVLGLDWVICGGESGPHARPMHPDWARSLRDQCAAAGVPFFFKQWGEWARPKYTRPSGTAGRFAIATRCFDASNYKRVIEVGVWPRQFDLFGGSAVLERVGKSRAGRLLDGVEHNAFPEKK